MTYSAKLLSQLYLVKHDSVIFLGLSPQDFQNFMDNRGLTICIHCVMSTERKTLTGNLTVKQSNSSSLKGLQTGETWSGWIPHGVPTIEANGQSLYKGKNHKQGMKVIRSCLVGNCNSSFGSVLSKCQSKAEERLSDSCLFPLLWGLLSVVTVFLMLTLASFFFSYCQWIYSLYI